MPGHTLDDGAVIQVRVVGELFSQTTITTFLYRYDVTGGPFPFGDVLTDLYLQFIAAGGPYDKLIGCISAAWTCQYVALQPVVPERLVASKPVPVVTSGQLIGTDLPCNTAATVTRRGEVAARSEVGGIHIPGMLVENLDAATNEWTGLFMNKLGAMAAQVVAQLPTGVGFGFYTPVLANLLATPVLPTQIVLGNANRTPRVMRRRTKGLGI